MSAVNLGLRAGAGLLALGFGKLVAAWAIARGPGPEIQGAFGLALACMSFGAIVLSLGFDYANAYVVGRRPGALGSVLANSSFLTLAGTLIGPLWALAFVSVFPKMVPAGASTAASVIVIGIGTAVTVFGQSLQSAAIGAQDLIGVAAANALTGLVWATTMIVAGPSLGFVGVALAWVLVVALAALVLMRRLFPHRGSGFRPAAAVFLEQARFGVRTVPGGVARALNLRAPLYWSSLKVTATDLGVFVLYLNIAEALLYLPNAIGQVLLAWSARHGTAAPSARMASIAVGAIGVTAAVGAVVLGGPILDLLVGFPYGAQASVLAVLLLATTAHSLGLLRIHTLMGLGNPGTASIAQLIALVVGTGSAIVLVPRWNLMGLAVSMLAAYLVFAAVLRRATPGAGPAVGPMPAEPIV